MTPTSPERTAADLAALGVYDPDAAHAAEQLQLLEYLISLGATAEDLVACREELPGLAAVVALRGGGALTLSEMIERSGVSEEKLLRIARMRPGEVGTDDPGARARRDGPFAVVVRAAASRGGLVNGRRTPPPPPRTW